MSQQYKRIAVKIGSNVLTRKDGALDVTRMSALVDQIAELRENGVEVILISSGAVASGRGELKEAVSRKMDSVDQRQLFSAVGQAKLINRYYELFREHRLPVGQVLTMKESFSTRRPCGRVGRCRVFCRALQGVLQGRGFHALCGQGHRHEASGQHQQGLGALG